MMDGPRKKAPKTIAGDRSGPLFWSVFLFDLPGGVSRRRLHHRGTGSRRAHSVRRSGRPLYWVRVVRDPGEPDGAPNSGNSAVRADYDAINMVPFEEVVRVLQEARS